MSLQAVRERLEARSGTACVQHPAEAIERLGVPAGSVLEEYLLSCLLPDERLMVSGVYLANLEGIFEESFTENATGYWIAPHGFVVIATSIGGNAICVDVATGWVYWSSSSRFSEDGISYFDDETQAFVKQETLAPETVRGALKLLHEDLPQFLLDLVDDRLEEALDELD